MRYTHILISFFVCQLSFVFTQDTLKIDKIVDSTIVSSIDSLSLDSLKINASTAGLDTLENKENLSASSIIYNYLKKNTWYSSAIIIPIVYFIVNDGDEKVKKTGPPPAWP